MEVEVPSPVCLHTRHGLCTTVSNWWRDDDQTLHVTASGDGDTMDVNMLLHAIDDDNPTVNGTWEWKKFSARISKIRYGTVYLS